MSKIGQPQHTFDVSLRSVASFPAYPPVSINHSRLDRPYRDRCNGRLAIRLALLSCLLLVGVRAGGQSTPATLTPSSGTLSGSQTFTWSNGSGPTAYRLLLGTAGAGSSNLYGSGVITATSATVTLPANGVTVYARFYQELDGVWQYADSTYTESGTPVLAKLSPASPAVLAASQTFTWNNGAGPADYRLLLGTTGAGSSNLYGSGITSATSATVTLPPNGVTVYARFYQELDGVWQYADSTYTESGTPVLGKLSPASPAVLAASQTFTWNNGAGPADYRLLLGTTGVGSSNLYGSGITSATSATVTLPANGVTVYARFYQELDGVWQYADSTYTESGTPVLAKLSPASPAVLAASQTFTWNNGAGPADYRLLLGTTGVGSSNLYGSGITSATSATVTLPANGVTVYARFYQELDGVWQFADSTYTESGPDTLSALSCTPGAITGAGTLSCHVNLATPAGTSGQAVNVSSNDTAVVVPSSVTVAAGATSATFTATVSAVSAAQTATLTATSGGGTETCGISLGAAVPTLTLSATSVNLGTVAVGGTGTGSMTLTSSGTAAVTVSAGSVRGTGYSISGVSYPLTLNPGQTATLTVSFGPTSAGLISGSVTLTSNSSTGTTSTISLSGTGQPVLSGLTCTSGSITGAASDACTVTLNSAAVVGGFPVSLASSSSAVSVPASVTVASGAASASFSASASAVSTTQTATISATAMSADPTFVIQLNPVTITPIHRNAHGVTDTGTTLTASPITVPLSNVAAGDLIVCEVSLESRVTLTTVSDAVNGTYSPAIAMHTNTPVTQQLGIFAIPNAAGGSYSVSVAWTGGAQTYQAMACQSWTGVATSAPQDANMTKQQDGLSVANPTSGSVATPASAGELVIGNLMTLNQIPTDGTNYAFTDAATITQMFPEYWIQTTTTATNAPYTNPTDTWTDQMVAFKPISSGVGVTAPSITSASAASGTVGGSFSYQITATNSPTSYGATALPAGLTLNTSTGLISGTPTVAGTSTVTLTATNAGGTGTASMSLAIAAGGPVLSVNATSVPFGDVTDGSPTYQSVTLTSSGTAAVTVSAGSVSGTGYTISGVSFPSTLNPGQTATIEIEFDPTTPGASNGSVTLTSNSTTGTTSTISLSGTGAASSYEVSLTWDAPGESSDPVAGYNVYRAVGGSSTYQLLNSSVDPGISYTDTAVTSNTSYTYYIESVDAEGIESLPSSTFPVSIP